MTMPNPDTITAVLAGNSPLTDERLKELLAACEKATPGPWEKQNGTDVYTHIVRGPNHRYIMAAPQGSRGQESADASYVAACDPQTITALIQELLSLRQKDGEMVEAVREAQDVLAEYIDPGIELSEQDCINRLLGILDNRDLVVTVRTLTHGAKNGRL